MASSRLRVIALAVLAAVLVFAPSRARAQAFAAQAEQVDRLFARWGAPQEAPGSSVLVIRDGEVIYEHVDGLANIVAATPITPATQFYIASVSKQFTGACIALLEQRRRLSLDDAVRRYIPELPAVYDGVTIAHLVHHTSGVRDFQTLLDTAGRTDAPVGQRDIVALLARQRGLRFLPGERYEYSNSNYFLLGVIVERVSGQSLRAFAEQNIFRRLRMHDTQFRDDASQRFDALATGYVRRRSGGYAERDVAQTVVGSAGVITTARDLARWDANFYRNRLGGGRAFNRRMVSRGVLNNGESVDYAFGVELAEHRGLPVVRHDGGFAGFVASIIRFPDQKFTIIYLTNERGDIDAVARSFAIADIYLADRLAPLPAPAAQAERAQPPAPAPQPAPPADLAAFAGDYFSDELQVTYSVTLAGGQLRMRFEPVIDGPLAPAGGDTFRLFGAIGVRFDRDAAGRVAAFTPLDGGARDIRFERVR